MHPHFDLPENVAAHQKISSNIDITNFTDLWTVL